MKPFDFLSDNPFDWLNADRCRPAEHESYLSNSTDDEKREQDHTIEQQPQRQEPEPLPPGRGWISTPQPRPQSRVNGSFVFGVPLPLRESVSEPPPGRFVTS